MHISIHVDGMLCWCNLFICICHKRSLITLCVSLIFYFWTDKNTLNVFPSLPLGTSWLMRTYKLFYCSDALVHPKFNLLKWDCESECEYSCMWNTVSLFKQHGVKIPQFYGKVNILDIQPIVYCVIYSLGWAGIVNLHLPSLMNT
mgnify:CR=1 FL=1